MRQHMGQFCVGIHRQTILLVTSIACVNARSDRWR